MEPEEIRTVVKSNRAVIGTELTLKQLKQGALEKVIITKNCPASAQRDIRAHLADAELVELAQTNQQLGIICKKPFTISVIGVLRA